MEAWKDVPGFPGYQVSDAGNVRSYWKRVGNKGKQGMIGVIQSSPRLLKLSRRRSDNDYRCVVLCRDGEKRRMPVHHLVALVFIGPRPKGKWVLHKNDVASDNRAGNLYYGTHQENVLDRARNGHDLIGSQQPRAKLTESDIPVIRKRFASGEMLSDLGREYGTSRVAIANACRRKTWKHVI